MIENTNIEKTINRAFSNLEKMFGCKATAKPKKKIKKKAIKKND